MPEKCILLLNTQMEAGGTQKAMLSLAQGLKSQGYVVIVVTMYDKGEFIPLFKEQYQLDILNLRMKSPGNWWQKIKAFGQGLCRLRQLLHEYDVQILHTFGYYSNILGPLVAWRTGISVCITSQRGIDQNKKWFIRYADRLITNSSLVNMMTAVSDDVRQHCIQHQHIKPEKLVVIYNGIQIEQYDFRLQPVQKNRLLREIGLNDEDRIVTTVARLHPVKGYRYLVAAIPGIIQKIPDVHFLFVGGGELRAELEFQLRQAKLESKVHLLGVRQNIPELLAISDLFVLPSLSEGMPNVVLEAMAAGLPVVGTRVAGTKEVVQQGQTGLLVSPANAQELEQSIITLLTDKAVARKMGEAGKQRIQKIFPIEENLTKNIALYDSLLCQQPSKKPYEPRTN